MYESSTKETSGCASNLLAHEDLGHFEEAHRRNIQAKFYNEKFLQVYESDNIWDSIWRTCCYFQAQVWKRDSNIAPPFFPFLGLSFFSFGLFLGGNALIMMIITLLLITTHELQLDTRTNYDSIWMPPAVYREGQWIKSDMYENLCMVALPQIRCQLHDHVR